MPTTALTELAVAKFNPPKAGRVEYFDARLPSFGLRITSAGAKSWVVMQRVDGKLRRVTLGRYPELGLGDARTKAHEVIAGARKGEAPLTSRARRALEAKGGEVVEPVAAVLADYVQRYQRGKGLRSWRQVEQTLTRELGRAGWMDRPLGTITRRDVTKLLDGIVDRGAPISGEE
jgi:hypothetical protein